MKYQELQSVVADTERAFAKTMADRNFEAFLSFLHPDTIFFSGESEIRGRDAVGKAWRPLFDGEMPPFSWSPKTVSVQSNGLLALSSGPIYNPDGTQVAVFNSIWQKQSDGRWLIIFDKGGQYCPD